jgi:hypothetical protein
MDEGTLKLLRAAQRKAELIAKADLHHDSLVPIIERLTVMAMDDERRRMDAIYILDYLARFVKEPDLRDALKCLENAIWYAYFRERADRENRPTPEPLLDALRCLEIWGSGGIMPETPTRDA